MERFFILDGMAIAYRAYFAFINRPLINSKGLNTSAIFGFVSTLEKILADEQPEHIAVAFDTKEPTFRHKEFPEYKATREKMPEDMIEQLPYLKKIVTSYNIPVIELPGWEADDIIGTLARKAEKNNLECYMVTPDKDYMQLVSDRIKMYRPGKSGEQYEVIGHEGVRKKFGVAPDQVTDVLGLIGDTSDNIPGVRGIGEKTAIPLVQEYHSLEGIYENIEQIGKPSVKKKLIEQKELAFLSKKLVTIDCDAPVELDPQDLRAEPKNIEALRALYTELELSRFLQRLDEQTADQSMARQFKTAADTPHEYITVLSPEGLREMVKAVGDSESFCFDTETTGTDANSADLIGMSFAVRPGHAWYVPVCEEIPIDEMLRQVTPLFSGGHTIIGQNLKYDLLLLRKYGIRSTLPLFDTMLASYILTPEGEHKMDALARQYLEYDPIPISALIGSGKDQIGMSDVPLVEVAEYAAEDADITLQLAEKLAPEIEKTGQRKLLMDIEFPLIHVLTEMEHRGVRIDVEGLGLISTEMESRIRSITGRIHELAGDEFNIASTKQLGVVLFENLGLPTGKKTKTGYSTDVSVLESLLGKHPIIEELLAYRQLTKLKSTYVDALPKMVNTRTGRIHTSYNQAVAATGRLSSTNPNLQNIPIRTDTGREIRRAFVPENEEFLMLSADYSQIELRLAAEISGDEGLVEAFVQGEDIHSSTAIKLFDVSPEDVTPDMRRMAKTTNFGILYGISAFGLAQRLGISNADAKDLIDLYFTKYPGINKYMSDTIAFGRENGFVETMMGRRRYVPEIKSKNRNVRMFAERIAINAPIQGSAADMIKIAMIDIHREMGKRNMKSHMLLQVHDELVFESHVDETDELRDMVIRLMTGAMNVKVPIVVDTGAGSDWLEAH